jgi:hypothetical protein
MTNNDITFLILTIGFLVFIGYMIWDDVRGN